MQKFKCKFVKLIDLVIQGNVKLSTNNIKKVRVQLSWITFDFNFVFSWLLFDRALKNGSLLLYVLYQLSRDDSIAVQCSFFRAYFCKSVSPARRSTMLNFGKEKRIVTRATKKGIFSFPFRVAANSTSVRSPARQPSRVNFLV